MNIKGVSFQTVTLVASIVASFWAMDKDINQEILSQELKKRKRSKQPADLPLQQLLNIKLGKQ